MLNGTSSGPWGLHRTPGACRPRSQAKHERNFMAELLDEFLASLEDFGERELTVEDRHGRCHGTDGGGCHGWWAGEHHGKGWWAPNHGGFSVPEDVRFRFLGKLIRELILKTATDKMKYWLCFAVYRRQLMEKM